MESPKYQWYDCDLGKCPLLIPLPRVKKLAMAVVYFPYRSSKIFSIQSTVFPSSASAMAM